MKLIYGAGVNDADFNVSRTVFGRSVFLPEYTAWANMLQRCYSKHYKAKQPTYVGCVVCADWLYFTKFREWWLLNYKEGYHLDKDLLSDSFMYSPDTCVYVPQWLNNFVLDNQAQRGLYLIGVNKRQIGKYSARCKDPMTGKKLHLGDYNTPTLAHTAWLQCKLAFATKLKPQMDLIDSRIYPRVVVILQSYGGS